THSGYTDLHFRGALVFATHQGQDAVLHRSGRSVVSAELARRPGALLALAQKVGVPVAEYGDGDEQSAYRCHLLLIAGEQIATLLVPPSSAVNTTGSTRGTSTPAAAAAIGLPQCRFPELLQ